MTSEAPKLHRYCSQTFIFIHTDLHHSSRELLMRDLHVCHHHHLLLVGKRERANLVVQLARTYLYVCHVYCHILHISTINDCESSHHALKALMLHVALDARWHTYLHHFSPPRCFTGSRTALCTTGGRFACCWLAVARPKCNAFTY